MTKGLCLVDNSAFHLLRVKMKMTKFLFINLSFYNIYFLQLKEKYIIRMNIHNNQSYHLSFRLTIYYFYK